MRTHYFSRVIIRFFMNVQAEEIADRDQESEEIKVDEENMNPCVQRKQKKRLEA